MALIITAWDLPSVQTVVWPATGAEMSVLVGQRLTLINGIVLSLSTTLFRQHTTIGRVTLVFEASVVNTAQLKGSALYGKLELSSNLAGHPKVENPEYARNNAKETARREKFLRNILQIKDCPLSQVALRLSKDKDLGELYDFPETLLSIKEVGDAMVSKEPCSKLSNVSAFDVNSFCLIFLFCRSLLVV